MPYGTRNKNFMLVIRESQKGKGKTLSGRFHVEERFTVDSGNGIIRNNNIVQHTVAANYSVLMDLQFKR